MERDLDIPDGKEEGDESRISTDKSKQNDLKAFREYIFECFFNTG